MAIIRFGTCSWKYDSWQGLVYTDQAKKNYLLEYGQKYDTVEIDQFTTFIQKCDPGFNYGIEIRNPNYLNKKFFDFLQQNKLGHVFCQGYYMPDITQVYAHHWPMITTTTAIHLIGPDRSDIEEKSEGQWDKIYDPMK